MISRITCLFGVVVLILLAWCLSEKRKNVNWLTVLGALSLEALIASLVFLVPGTPNLFVFANKIVIKLLTFSREGAFFLFGSLALGPGEVGAQGETSLGFFLAFQVLPAVIFFSALMSLSYHLKLIQPIIRSFAMLFKRFMRLSGAEALCASSNIVVGVEAVFVIRPYLAKLTRAELFTILTACMSTVASTTLALYVLFLQNELPTIAGHLLSASVLSIPAAVLISKVMIPEVEIPQTIGQIPRESERRHTSFMAAITEGAHEGVKLAVGIAALLIAVLSLVAMLNWLLGWLSGYLPGVESLSLERMLGWLMLPFVFLLGIPQPEWLAAAQLLGERLILTEVVAYRDLAHFAAQGLVSDRTLVVMSYALCGFTHVASVAIFVGGVSALIPERRDEIASLGLRALLAAILVTVMTGCIAGIFYHPAQSFLFST